MRVWRSLLQNLFATRFDQVMGFLEKRAATAADAGSSASGGGSLRHVLLDTPGQIEVFTWSASGAIITESLATAFPTVLVYVLGETAPRLAAASGRRAEPLETGCSTLANQTREHGLRRRRCRRCRRRRRRRRCIWHKLERF